MFVCCLFSAACSKVFVWCLFSAACSKVFVWCLFSATCSKCDVYFLLKSLFSVCSLVFVLSLLSVWCYSQFTQLKCPLIVLSTIFAFEYLKFNVTLKSSCCFQLVNLDLKVDKLLKYYKIYLSMQYKGYKM